jgi:ribonuclease R
MAAPEEGFVGVVARRGRFTIVEPLFERGTRVTVDARRGGASAGEIVLIRGARAARGGGRARIERVIGRPEVARDVIEALLVERGHARSFDEQVEQEAAASAAAPDRLRRRDLTDLPTFTIDPAEARDFDDAVSAASEGDGFKVHVHIADVAAHVTPGSALDHEARRRGNSVYVPGAVEPMLPEALSNRACSLVPGEPRKAVTVEIELDREGAVRSASFHRSLIRSDRRLSYEEVERVFAREAPQPEPVAAPLALARTVAALLRRRRLSRGALGLETSEPEFEFNADGHVVRAIDDVQTESHSLIEELMILANEQVAGELERRRKPTLYRVHEQPEPAAIEFLVAQLESLDVPTPPLPRHMTPRVASELVGVIGVKVAEHVRRTGHGREALTSLVLRSLKQAYYSPTNVGHAGLASPSYLHFTSPIRRYPDLVVHRALLAAVGAEEEAPQARELSELGWHCSQTEREAAQVEHAADDVCLAFLLEHDLFVNGWEREFEGEVSGLVSGGAFVSFAPGGKNDAVCEGFLPARTLGDYFDMNEEATALVGRRSGRQLRLADSLDVRVRGVEPPRGRVDLVPATKAEPARGGADRNRTRGRRS